VPTGLALGKATVNGAGAVTVAFLCRVPDKRHSAKRSLPINFLPCVLYRVSHSAKTLPSAIWPLPRHSAKNLNPVVADTNRIHFPIDLGENNFPKGGLICTPINCPNFKVNCLSRPPLNLRAADFMWPHLKIGYFFRELLT